MTSQTRLAVFAWVAVCLLWGTTYLGIRIALETIPPMLMGGLRWTIAGALLLGVMALRGDDMPGPKQWPSLSNLGFLLIGLGNGGVVWAERTLPSGLTAVLVAVTPFWMVGVERLAGGPVEPLTAPRVTGLLVGFAGIVLLVWPELEFGPGTAFLAGVAATQIASVGWAIGSSYSRRRRPSENVLAVAAFQMFFGGVFMLAAGLALGEWSHLAFSVRSGSALVYLLLFGAIGGFSCYAYALKHLPLTFVSLYAYVNPVIAMVLGTLVLGEPMNARIVVAGVVVLGGMALVRR